MHMMMLFSLADAPTSDLYSLDTIIATMAANQLRYISQVAKKEPTVLERNLMAWEPRCMGWYV